MTMETEDKKTLRNLSSDELEIKIDSDSRREAKKFKALTKRIRKMVILGEGCVGKTTLITRYYRNEYKQV